MSKTPRTDAAMEQVIANGEVLHGGYMPLWVTSRQLERELAAALYALREAYADEAGWKLAMERALAVFKADELTQSAQDDGLY